MQVRQYVKQFWFVIILFGGLACSPVWALTIIIDDIAEGPPTVNAIGAGPAFTVEPAPEGSLTLIFLDPTQLFNIQHSLALTEPGTNIVSDLITIFPGSNGPPNPFGGLIDFTSDVNGTPLNSFGAPSIPETGGFQDITLALFGPSDTPPEGFHILVRSDVDNVPEPATMVLFCTGLGLLGLLDLARRRKVA